MKPPASAGRSGEAAEPAEHKGFGTWAYAQEALERGA